MSDTEKERSEAIRYHMNSLKRLLADPEPKTTFEIKLIYKDEYMSYWYDHIRREK